MRPENIGSLIVSRLEFGPFDDPSLRSSADARTAECDPLARRFRGPGRAAALPYIDKIANESKTDFLSGVRIAQYLQFAAFAQVMAFAVDLSLKCEERFR